MGSEMCIRDRLLGSTAAWPEGRSARVIDGLKANAKAAHEVSHADGWLKFTRGKLDGAGSWTGLYGNNSKTSSTGDRLVKGPLGVLWFGEPGSEHMVDRHASSVSPLAVNGRLFVQGMEVVMAYDATTELSFGNAKSRARSGCGSMSTVRTSQRTTIRYSSRRTTECFNSTRKRGKR